MKKPIRMLPIFALALLSLALSACGGAIAPAVSSMDLPGGGAKVRASQVAFTGRVEAINGNEWIIDGQRVLVDASATVEPVSVGEMVKVQATVGQDGSVQAMRIERPASPAAAVATTVASPTPQGTPSTGTPIAPQATSTDTPNDNEVYGVVESFDGSTLVIGGITYTITDQSIIDGSIAVGNTVEVKFTVGSDGSLVVVKVEPDDLSNDMSSDTSTDQGLSNDNEVYGVVESFDGSTLVIDGVTYTITDQSIIDGSIAVGNTVEVKFTVGSDGSLVVVKAEPDDISSDMSSDSSDDDMSDDYSAGSSVDDHEDDDNANAGQNHDDDSSDQSGQDDD